MISSAPRSQSKSRGEFNLDLIRAFRTEQNDRIRRDLRNRVLELNLGLVRRVTSHFASTVQDENEFFSEGCLALIDAVEKYDPERGFQFSTYATTCIRNRLFRLFRKRARSPIEIPLDQTSLECEPTRPSSDRHQLDEFRILSDEILREIPERERHLIRLRFGLDSKRQSRSFREVSEVVGLSKERVRQLVQRAILSIQSNVIVVPSAIDSEY